MNTTLMAGAGLGFLVTAWAHVKAVFGYLRNMVVMTVKVQMAWDVHLGCSSLLSKKRIFRLGDIYMAVSQITGVDRKAHFIGAEAVIEAGPLLVFTPFPVIVQKDSINARFTFLRGTFNVRKFLKESMEEGLDREDHKYSNFGIEDKWGSIKAESSLFDSSNPPTTWGGGKDEAAPESSSSDSDKYPRMCYQSLACGSIKHMFGDTSTLGFRDFVAENQRFIKHIYKTPEQEYLLKEIDHFLQSRAWYEERAIPWKRGLLLQGPPGTGKSSIVYAVARYHDLPVRVYHLDTMTSEDLVKNWHGSAHGCIHLFEDIDAIFENRTNLHKSSMHPSLTFDCFLNVLDGVAQSQGVITIITTNFPEKLDDALSGERPGRIDRVIECGPLKEEGKRFIMNRILNDVPDQEREEFYVKHLDNGPLSGAVIQERCIQYALQRKWS